MSTDVIDISNRQKMNWTTTIVLVLFHIGAVAALFMFSWKAFLVSAAL
ncbi:MAG: acyl-CoA desaturase, partial [Bryobacterales bacterium]|nr:acyl-CoA desaturase [Bryobacterales bacterium]